MRHEESILQRRFVQWFRRSYPHLGKMLFSVPNGGLRSKAEAGIMKAEGMQAGVTDLILLIGRGGYNSLCIEWKTTSKSSSLSPEQREWHEIAKEYDNCVIIVRTFEQAVNVIHWYFSLEMNLSPIDYKSHEEHERQLSEIIQPTKKRKQQNEENKLFQKLMSNE